MSRTISKTERICLNCNSDKTYIRKDGHEDWYHYKEGYICKKCRHKLIDNPKNNPKTHPRLMTFKGKRIVIKQKARIGKCILCWKKIGDIFLKKVIRKQGYKELVYIMLFTIRIIHKNMY